jgi:transglutaminase-like putative cysteine protease
VKTLAAELVPIHTGVAGDMTKLIQWVNANMKYDHANCSLAASSQHALTEKAGHCSDYHGLCSALGRSLGYPTRVTYGINPFPKNGPSHCKLEAFVPSHGWVSFDVSETQKMIADIGKDKALDDAARQALIAAANQRLASGFRDNTWILHTRGTDYELAPKASRRVPVVRTAYIEADGKALKDPDPNSATQVEFSWMTAHDYRPDRKVSYPFKDTATLR